MKIIHNFGYIICLLVFSFFAHSTDFICNACELKFPHKHMNDWFQIKNNNNDSLLFKEQYTEHQCYSNLVFNIYNFLKNKDKILTSYKLKIGDFKEMLSCFSNNGEEENLDFMIKTLHDIFPNARFIDYGLYDPYDKSHFIKKVQLENGEEMELIKKSFAKIPILLVEETNCEICLDKPKDRYVQYLNKVNTEKNKLKYILNSLPLGISSGILCWGILMIKDIYIGTTAQGGAEFESLSIPGFVLPIGLMTSLIATIAVYLKVDYSVAMMLLYESLKEKFI